MNDYLMSEEYNRELKERFDLASARIRQIAREDAVGLAQPFADYFAKMAEYLMGCTLRYEEISGGTFSRRSLEELQRENEDFYSDISPQNYEHSYANPACSVRVLGEEFGRILSFLYTELRGLRAFVFTQDL